ncbi:MAG TPA: permease [Chitinophagaceae bacterium]|nr:permease [Chitinophagaceae bacterium]
MKSYFGKNKMSLLLLVAYSVFTIASYSFNFTAGKEIFSGRFIPFTKEMMLFLPFMFILIGLADTWISKEKVMKLVGEGSSIKGTVLIILLSMLQAGPLYSVFPVAYLLWKKGSSTRNIFIYIGAFSTLKLPLLMFEISFLGWKFSMLRTLITLPVIIVISLVMEKYTKNKNFTIHNV